MTNCKEVSMYIKFFRHFAERLSERYGVLITFQEYVKLCDVTYLKRSKLDRKDGRVIAKIGYIEIQGVNVKCVRQALKPKLFITALPIKNNNERNNIHQPQPNKNNPAFQRPQDTQCAD
jgi:hypothetical protein